MNRKAKAGGLPRTVFRDPGLQQYITGAAFGWLGHSARTETRDRILARELTRLEWDAKRIAQWVCSRGARHFADHVCGMTPAAFRAYVREIPLKWEWV